MRAASCTQNDLALTKHGRATAVNEAELGPSALPAPHRAQPAVQNHSCCDQSSRSPCAETCACFCTGWIWRNIMP